VVLDVQEVALVTVYVAPDVAVHEELLSYDHTDPALRNELRPLGATPLYVSRMRSSVRSGSS
jgi:hypothetical protein